MCWMWWMLNKTFLFLFYSFFADTVIDSFLSWISIWEKNNPNCITAKLRDWKYQKVVSGPGNSKKTTGSTSTSASLNLFDIFAISCAFHLLTFSIFKICLFCRLELLVAKIYSPSSHGYIFFTASLCTEVHPAFIILSSIDYLQIFIVCTCYSITEPITPLANILS